MADINWWHQSPIRPDIESVPAQLVGAEMVPAPAQDQVVAALSTDGRYCGHMLYSSTSMICFQKTAG
jgi:hypothetical protein